MFLSAIFDDAPSEYVPTRRSHRRGDHEEDDHRRRSDKDRSRGSGRRDDKAPPPASSGSRYFEKPVNPAEEPTQKSTLAATQDFIKQLASKSKVTDEQVRLGLILVADVCFNGWPTID